MIDNLFIALAGFVTVTLVVFYQFRFVTLKRRAAEAERHAEDARRLKSEFIAKVSHELKTPLNSAVGYVDLLREKKYGLITAEQDDILRRVGEACQRLLALIHDLLDFSGADLGRIKVAVASFDLNDELRGTFEMVEKLAEEKGIHITASYDPRIGEIRSDRQKMHQSIINVLSNAIKFTEKGHIALRSALIAGDEMVLIEVADTGIGIDETEIPHVFDEFRQADGSIRRDFGGQGLGLSIAQKFVHFLGGEIGITSEKGKGTTVRIVVPKAIEHPMRREEERAPARKALRGLP